MESITGDGVTLQSQFGKTNGRNVFLLIFNVSVYLFITDECHCHSEVECEVAEDCFKECGENATCDNNHCHGDCVHHRK